MSSVVKWLMLDVSVHKNPELEEKKLTGYQSGNGWKPATWADVVKAVAAANPEANPTKDQVKIITKLNYLKDNFELYLYVAKFSGSGWDDKDKHATNTDEYITSILAAHGDKYAKCFKKACPFYAELDSLYNGLRNRATGDHVVHLGRKRRTKKSSKENPENIDDPLPEAGPSNNDADTNRAPLAPLNADDTGCTAAENNSYDDELLETPTDKRTKGTGKRQRAVSEVSDNGDCTKGSRKRQKSDPTSIARRNAEAGTQLSRSVDNLSAAMLKPIVTTEDLSHVDNIIDILRDKTLLPPDPKGKLFRIVSSELSRNTGLARVFILEDDHVRRQGLLEGILEDANIEIPEHY
ncbi:hypothetical protein C8J57DRAFT_1230615 [Mycena rebaudengoi]|nr:hypothetical protein C8J57DRAFT_1230615 [Mycena rebaudengoi]